MRRVSLNEHAVSYFLEHMEDAIFLTNRNGVLAFANPAALALLGIDQEALGRKKIWEYIPFVPRNDDLVQLFIEAIQARETTRHMVVDFENNSGALFRFRVSLTYSEVNGGSFMILINNLTDYEKATSALSRYTSPRIADLVLRSGEEQLQAGQSREITVLMSDLRGFTAMSTSMPPQRLVSMLNHYFGVMIQAIEAWKGCIIEFLGDGIFVVFGAPDDDPDHASHAVACAIEMQNAMEEVNRWNGENGFPALSMGIGISSGPAVVGSIGSSEKMKYGCVGETVNMAGRIEGLTVGRQVLISQAAADLIREELSVRSTRTILPKGARDPISVYEVTALGSSLRLRDREIAKWHWLSAPAAVSFHLLSDRKMVERETCLGELLALSEDRRHAVLRAGQGLTVGQHLMLTVAEGLYARVTGLEQARATLCFTSVPACFDAWAEELLSGGEGLPPEE